MALSIPIISEFDGKGIDKAIKEFFKPEFRNRVDLICKFGKLF